MAVAAAVVITAVVITAGVAFAVVVVVMVAAGCGIVDQLAADQRLGGFIGAALYAAIQLDAGLTERLLRTAADAAADDDVHMAALQEAGQCAVTLSFGFPLASLTLSGPMASAKKPSPTISPAAHSSSSRLSTSRTAVPSLTSFCT